MKLADYLRSCIGEFVLLLLCTWSLEVLVMDGFYVSGELQFGPVPAIVSAVLLLVMYLAAWRQRGLLVGAIATVVVVAVVIGGSLVMSGGPDPYADAYGNWFWAAVVCVAVTVAGFLLTRTLVGAGAWFVLCVFVAALVQMFFESQLLPFTLAVLFSSLSLLVFCNIRTGQTRVDSSSGTSNVAGLVAACAPVLVFVGVACVAWFAVIAPLNPGVLDVKLLTEYRKENIEQVRGVGSEQMQVNTDMTSDQLVEGDRFTTDDLKVDEDAETSIDAKAVEESSTPAETESNDEAGGSAAQGQTAGERETLERESLEERWSPESYTMHLAWLPFVLAGLGVLVLAVVTYFLVRRMLRRRRLERLLSEGGTREQVTGLYLFIMQDLGKLGFALPNGTTIIDHARNTRTRMETIRLETRVPFDMLTGIYEKTAYGDYEPDEDEVAAFAAYYLRFWKAARKQLGSVRYFFRSFRLG